MTRKHYEFVCPMTVRFRDVDTMKVVNHAEILSYFETVRTEYMMTLMNHGELRDLDYIIASVQCDYLSPVQYGDRLLVGTRVEHVGQKSVTLDYLLEEHDTGRSLARGETIQVYYDYERESAVPVPDLFQKQLENWRTRRPHLHSRSSTP